MGEVKWTMFRLRDAFKQLEVTDDQTIADMVIKAMWNDIHSEPYEQIYGGGGFHRYFMQNGDLVFSAMHCCHKSKCIPLATALGLKVLS